MRSRSLPQSARWVGRVGLGFTLAGCSQLDPVTPFQQITDPAQLYTSLAIDHRAVNLATVAPYDTIQFRAVPLNALGETMPGMPAPTFSLGDISDTVRVTLTPDGFLQAKAPTDSYWYVQVVAELKVDGNIRHADTALVQIFEGTPTLVSTLLFDGAPPDSTRQGTRVSFDDLTVGVRLINPLFQHNLFNSRSPANIKLLDANGDPVPDLLIEYSSLNRSLAVVAEPFGFAPDKPQIFGIFPGEVGIVARTTAFGTTLADTLPLTVTWPVIQVIDLTRGAHGEPVFHPSDVRLGTSAIVLFWNRLGDTADVTFDNETNVSAAPSFVCDVIALYPNDFGPGPVCDAGSVQLPRPLVDSVNGKPAVTGRVRQFMVPGVYPYHDSRTGATGRIVVTDALDGTSLP